MDWVAQVARPGGDVPLSAYIAGWSVLVMLTVLFANLMTYLLRHRVEQTEKLVQQVRSGVYKKHILNPVAAVIVAALSGYGVNTLTDDSGGLGYLGFLLALPLPVFMVWWNGYRAMKDEEFERHWPPKSLSVKDRVKIRITLQWLREQSDDLETADLTRVNPVLEMLQDQVLPALQERRDQSLRRWIQERRTSCIAVLVWSAATVVVAATTSAYLFLIVIALVVILFNAGLLSVSRKHHHYRVDALAKEVAEKTGALRRRITEHKLGIATP